MWELMQKILKDKLTPNQLLLLYCLKNKVSTQQINNWLELKGLQDNNLVEGEEGSFSITTQGKMILRKYDNYFVKAKKKTNIQLMGKDFLDKINEYRNIFPAGKLPSGKPARVNVRSLETNFRWFFEEYSHDWDTIIKATKMYVNQYEENDFNYMMTSQYFIAKQDKHKVKTSTLADYCDMIIDGVSEITDNHFKEKVV